ncbi:hypothetical protein [Microbispora sp. CA-102843]|uniref:hypothetical protein n=1 Tax=Microbispora sp. CA-102843 TaxID=3239952 RepID=UPI003D90BBF3
MSWVASRRLGHRCGPAPHDRCVRVLRTVSSLSAEAICGSLFAAATDSSTGSPAAIVKPPSFTSALA